MRTGDPPGCPDLADQRAAADLLAGMHEDCRQVAVHGDQPLAVIDQHGVAVEEITAGVDHPAAGGGVHCGAGRGGDVHAGMRIARLVVEDAARAERTGAHPGDRRAQLQRRRRLVNEGRERLVQVTLLAFDTRQVALRQVYLGWRHAQALQLVLLGRNLECQHFIGRGVGAPDRDRAVAG